MVSVGDRRVSGVLVEFFGLPGAGKSTVAARTRERLRDRGIGVIAPTSKLADETRTSRRLWGKATYAGRVTGSRPRYAVSSLRTIVGSGQRSPIDAVRTGFNWLFVSGILEAADCNRGSVWLLDQGLLQAAWSIVLSADCVPTDQLYRLLSSALSRVDTVLVVLVEASSETVRRRLDARTDGDTRIAANRAGYAIDAAIDATERIRSMTDELSATVGLETVSVWNERPADIDPNAELIAQRVAALPAVTVGESP